VLSKITGPLPRTFIHSVNVPSSIYIADTLFNYPGSIDILIGGDTYWDIICDEKVKTKDGPYLQKTLLGWVVVGKISAKLSTTKLSSCLQTQNQYQLLDNKIELFLKMEELSSKHNFTDEEKSCMIHFNQGRRGGGAVGARALGPDIQWGPLSEAYLGTAAQAL